MRLANPVNYVPRVTPVAVPQQQIHASDDNLPIDVHRDAYPLLTVPEQRRSRQTPSPNSLVVERSQGETESGRTSIALPRRQRRSTDRHGGGPGLDMAESARIQANAQAAVAGDTLRPPEPVHVPSEPRVLGDERPRHVPSQISLNSQSQVASVPSNTNTNPNQPTGAGDVAEELAWGPAHPCFPHMNPHVPMASNEYLTTRVIRVRRDWMVRGDLAPTFSNLYPEILDPLLPEQEFRRVVAYINDELVKAFDPFSLRNWVDGAIGLLTGWLWEDIGGPAIKSHLKSVETWLENWNQEVGAKEGVRIWSLRRTAYLSLDIQIPDPKVGIVPNEASLPGTRPGTGAEVEV